MYKFLFPLTIAFIFLTSCSNDAYETGDSRYSYLRTDFAEVRTDAQSQLVSAITDDNISLAFSKVAKASWAKTADSTYRALLYYNIGDTTAMPMTVEPIKIDQVYVLQPQSFDTTVKSNTDPIGFQSAWISKNNKYANMTLTLKTGQAEDTKLQQRIGLACDSIVERNGKKHFFYRLIHDQGGIPQYYSQTIYISIPLNGMNEGDALFVKVNSYDGVLTKCFMPKP